MLNFITENSLIFLPITAQINNDKKKYIGLIEKWNERTYKECLNYYNTGFKTNEHFLIKCNNDFIIFDTDTEEEYNKLVNVLKELNLYNEKNITVSTRGNKYFYKRHFWFSVNEDNFKTMTKHHFDKLEIFIGSGQICELKSSKLDKLNSLSYMDYLKIKDIFLPQTLTNTGEHTYKPSEEKNYIKILNNLNKKRFQNYDYWIILYMIFVNENFSKRDFNYYSKLHDENYNEDNNERILKNITVKQGYTISTLYFWLKEDNYKIFLEMQDDRQDVWEKFEDIKNHSDLAKLYYNIKPNKYIKSEKMGWYEYDKNNILVYKGSDFPTSLLNDITKQLQTILIEQRNLTLPKDKNDKDYNNKMRIFKNAYNKLGTSNFIKGVMEYLKDYYTVDDIDNLIDGNHNLFSFKNLVYDNTIKDFREIKPNDYISKNTGYNINTVSNPRIKTEIINLIKSMFDDEDIYNYHMQTIALSMFGNNHEHFIMNSSAGRSGKGVCASLIEGSFGSYFYSGESTFFTTVYKADRPNPTLFNLKGVRYFLTTEPEADNETKFNIGLLKKLTGNDTITCRDLGKSNISYKPQFTCFLQCNQKPKLDKIDNAIKNRFRIIEFPFTFTQTPIKPNEKPININLKNMFNQDYYNEFILILLDINKSIDVLRVPNKILNNVDNYLNENNIIKKWLDENIIKTNNKKDIVKSSELLLIYNESGFQPLSQKTFNELMLSNNIETRINKGYLYFHSIKIKNIIDENYILID